jgi:hypothetical protein
LLLVNGWRDKATFLSTAAATASATYLPALAADAPVVFANVFGYHGQWIQTSAGVPVWGWYRVLLPFVAPAASLADPGPLLAFIVGHDWWMALGLIGFVAWGRRNLRALPAACATIAMSHAMVYGFTESWAFQYFAWSLPFWCFMPTWFLAGATALAGGYVYTLYALLCGNAWLLGPWDFMGHPYWPAPILVLRDLAVAFFFFSAGWFVIQAARSARASVAATPGSPGPGRSRP